MIGVVIQCTESHDIYEYPPTDAPLLPDGHPGHQQPEGSYAPDQRISRELRCTCLAAHDGKASGKMA